MIDDRAANLDDVRPIRIVGDPCLRRPARLVAEDEHDRAELRSFVDELVAAMRRSRGVGIAANQVGDDRAIFVMEVSRESIERTGHALSSAQGRTYLPLSVVINPSLAVIDQEQVEWFEGCLSCPGYVGLVSRHAGVSVTGVDCNGVPIGMDLHGWPARVAQHEFDHLQGRLYLDVFDTRSFISRQSYVDRWRVVPVPDFKAVFGMTG